MRKKREPKVYKVVNIHPSISAEEKEKIDREVIMLFYYAEKDGRIKKKDTAV